MTQLDPTAPADPRLQALPHSTALAQLVAPDVYRVATGISNAYLVLLAGPGAGYVVIDVGDKGYGRKIVDAARGLFGNVRPNAVLLTHGHFDHAGGLPELLNEWPGLPVYAHAMELPYLNDGVRYPPGDPTVGGAMAELSRFLDTSRPTLTPEIVKPFPDEAVELDMMPGWELRPSPGHTPGHVSFFNPEERILIAGDAVVTLHQNNPLAIASQRPVIFHPPPYATYNWHHARQSARSLAELEPYYLLTGHGLPIHGKHIATQLSRFAANFPTPNRGRYLRTPVRFNRHGPTFIPPKPIDYVKDVVLAGAAIAAGITLYALLKKGSRREQLPACE